MLEALIFDVDGTLAETEEAHRAAFNRAFSESGLGWEWDQPLYGQLLNVTGGKERIAHYLARGASVEAPLSAEDIARLHARKTAIFGEIVATGGVPLRPGVEALIRHAPEAGIRLAIATTTTLANVENLLGATLGEDGLDRFEVIAAGDEVPAKKPAPDVFLLALKRLGLPAGRCLALEDSAHGLASARAAGLAALITRSAYTASQNFDGAAAVVDNLVELVDGDAGRHGLGSDGSVGAALGPQILAELTRIAMRAA
ncbi:MAG: HAD-IA family hydrolase [Hyphomicrobiaceae bacterium]|nr:HAD-IA family hydrolase [Hyphomicrobiaceae bacterium]